jgi:hypothetical protein
MQMQTQTFEVPKTRVAVQFENDKSTFCTVPVAPGFDLRIKVATADGKAGVYVRPVIAPYLYPVTMTWTPTIGTNPCKTITHTFETQDVLYGRPGVVSIKALQDVGGTFLTIAISISSIVLPAAKVFAESARVAAAATTTSPRLPASSVESAEPDDDTICGGGSIGCGCDDDDST